MNRMMVLSVETAYATPAQIPGVPVGGKTGTAEVGGGRAPHAWFVGYAPADRPGVVVAVIMENQGSGTTFAAPAAQRVLEAALRLGY
jgi:peptidoglycan glycosyltransferase